MFACRIGHTSLVPITELYYQQHRPFVTHLCVFHYTEIFEVLKNAFGSWKIDVCMYVYIYIYLFIYQYNMLILFVIVSRSSLSFFWMVYVIYIYIYIYRVTIKEIDTFNFVLKGNY
jgi:hypothetical protein